MEEGREGKRGGRREKEGRKEGREGGREKDIARKQNKMRGRWKLYKITLFRYITTPPPSTPPSPPFYSCTKLPFTNTS